MERSKHNVLIIISFSLVIILVAAVCMLTLNLRYMGKQVTDKKNAAEVLNSRVAALETQAATDNSTIEEQKARIAELEKAVSDLTMPAAPISKPTNPDEKVAYLTFDDGPSPVTPRVLATLKQYEVKATFFVIGTKYSDYMKNIVADGHAIGVHSLTHDYAKIYKSTTAFWNDFNAMHQKIKEVTGIDTKICRFPGGGSNAISKKYNVGIMTALTKEMATKGYTYFDWNVSSGDAASGGPASAEKILNNIKNGIGTHTKVNILMHDAAAKSTTVDALPSIIEFLKTQGYRFDLLDDKSPDFHHAVGN